MDSSRPNNAFKVKQEPMTSTVYHHRSNINMVNSEVLLNEQDILKADFEYHCCMRGGAAAVNNVREEKCDDASQSTLEFDDSNTSNLTLWQFLLELLINGKRPDIIHWTNIDGEFQLLKAEEVAQLWGMRKNKNHRMNYDKLSRALRYYYQKNIIRKVHGQKFVYKFVGLDSIALSACKSALEGKDRCSTQLPLMSLCNSTSASAPDNESEKSKFLRWTQSVNDVFTEKTASWQPKSNVNTQASSMAMECAATNLSDTDSNSNPNPNLQSSGIDSSTMSPDLNPSCTCSCHHPHADRPRHPSATMSTKRSVLTQDHLDVSSIKKCYPPISASSSTVALTWPLDLSCSSTSASLMISNEEYTSQYHQQVHHSRHSANMQRLAEQLSMQQKIQSPSAGSMLTDNHDAVSFSSEAISSVTGAAPCVWMPIPIHLINRVWQSFVDPALGISSQTTAITMPSSPLSIPR